MKEYKISSDHLVHLTLTGADLMVLFEGLDQLLHKVAKPVEAKILQQLDQQLEAPCPPQ